MAHKTLINGTAYDITGGKALVSGTSYSVSGGKTLIGGTEYEIAFVRYISLTVSGCYDSNNCYYMLDGVKQTGKNSYSYSVNTIINNRQELCVYMKSRSTLSSVKLNGTTVQSAKTVSYVLDISNYTSVDIVFSSTGFSYSCNITAA